MTDYATWMTDAFQQLEDRCIWNVVLPATHNSGVFSALNTIGVRNQDRGIGEQLAGGIRAFDIRVTKRPDTTTYVMHHSGYYPADDSQLLETALRELEAFAASHPKEILVILLTPGYKSILDDADFPRVRGMVLEHLEARLVPFDDKAPDRKYTVGRLVKDGKNVILISGVGTEPAKAPLFWPDTGAVRHGTWQDFQGDWKITPEEKMSRLKPLLASALADRATTAPRFLSLDAVIWTVNLQHAATTITNPQLTGWLKEWAAQPELLRQMNLVTVDFFESNDSEIVRTVVELNGKFPKVAQAVTEAAPPPAAGAGAPNPPMIGHPHYVDAGSFRMDCARDRMNELGLDFATYEQELETKGTLGPESLKTLETKGIPPFVVNEYVRWHEATHVAATR